MRDMQTCCCCRRSADADKGERTLLSLYAPHKIIDQTTRMCTACMHAERCRKSEVKKILHKIITASTQVRICIQASHYSFNSSSSSTQQKGTRSRAPLCCRLQKFVTALDDRHSDRRRRRCPDDMERFQLFLSVSFWPFSSGLLTRR